VGDFLMGSTGVTQLRFERLMPPFRLDCTDLAGVGYDPKLTWGGQVSAEVLADNRYDHSKSPVHPTGHCHGRDRYASFRDRYAKPQTAPSDQARRRRALA
jgi:hypothetical protein